MIKPILDNILMHPPMNDPVVKAIELLHGGQSYELDMIVRNLRLSNTDGFNDKTISQGMAIALEYQILSRRMKE